MPWYKSGTVSVVLNSNAVIGAGTAFIANSRVGDAFRGPDGGWYEVTNIASDTALSISPNYQGATNAAGIYALAPMQGYVKDSADALRALVNQFGGVLAVLGTTPTTAGVLTALNLSNTDGLPEGATNKYHTDARVRAAILTGFVTTDPATVAATDSVLVGIGKLQAQNNNQLSLTGGTLTGALNEAVPVTLASAATTSIGGGNSNTINITGTATITAFGTITPGTTRRLLFNGVLTLVHNATSLILPGAANIVTAAGDVALMLSLGGGNWKCVDFQSVSGKQVSFSYDRSNVLGAVSQSGGLPTGAIIETGTNAAGRYIKYADGKLECWGYPGSIDQTVANTAYSTTFGLPATFVGSYAVFSNISSVNVANIFYGYSRASSLTGATYSIIQCWSVVQTYTYSVYAIGRWL